MFSVVALVVFSHQSNVSTDCCDGSDEEGTVACSNTCAQLASVHKQENLEEIQKHKIGAKKRKEYIELAKEKLEAKQLRNRLADQCQQLEMARHPLSAPDIHLSL